MSTIFILGLPRHLRCGVW